MIRLYPKDIENDMIDTQYKRYILFYKAVEYYRHKKYILSDPYINIYTGEIYIMYDNKM